MNRQESRKNQAQEVRHAAANLAHSRPHPDHIANGDEQRFRRSSDNNPSYLMSFTKGLPHDANGLVENHEDFQQFVKAINSGDPRDFRDTPLGESKNCALHGFKKKDENRKYRAWESQSAGLAFELEGHDSQSVTMPPAPRLGSQELTAEMAEVYAQALLRDHSFAIYNSDSLGEDTSEAETIIDELNQLEWFKADPANDPLAGAGSESRKRGPLSLHTAFRGITPGDNIGPYLSQFLLAGNNTRDGIAAKEGRVVYGGITIDQMVSRAAEEDFMRDWNDWLDVQHGLNTSGRETYNGRRFITTPRDLATYVHFDALYEAYLNACLILLDLKIPFDPGIPFQESDVDDHQQGFAHFGGPHILSLVTEVATRALKAVRFQKFNVHRRLRPEALAARLHKVDDLKGDAPPLEGMFEELHDTGLLDRVAVHGGASASEKNYLLPMAFSEGSPMHPTYGAGHATVAGACVTILKAFFDAHHPLDITTEGTGKAFVAATDDCDNSVLKTVDVDGVLTVEGELNKLASNISIGRDWAGVHYFSDYIESLRMGEQIALGILEEQKLTYGENFTMTVPLFDGGSRTI